MVNKGPDTVVIEKATGRKIQATPVRELRTKEEAKVVIKPPTPPATSEKTVPTPVRTQAEKTVPAVEPRQVEKPVVKTAEPQPPVTKKEVTQTDEQIRIAKLDEQKRAQQEKASEAGNEKAKSAPAAVEAKPEVKHETKLVAERPTATKEPTEQKTEKDDEKKD